MLVTDLHSYQPRSGSGLKHDPFYAIVGPRPIGWISSIDEAGILNLAPYSFFNAFNSAPPILGFCSVGFKDSVRNVKQTGEFVWNLATRPLAQAMNETSSSVPPEVNEFELSGLTAVPSALVKVPRVGEARVAMECKLAEIVQLKNAAGQQQQTWLVLGEVVMVHIDRALLRDGTYQTGESAVILRAGGSGGYAEIRPDVMFEMPRPT